MKTLVIFLVATAASLIIFKYIAAVLLVLTRQELAQ